MDQFCKRGHDTHVLGRRGSRCRECDRIYSRAWTAANPERVKANTSKNQAKQNEATKRWNARNPEKRALNDRRQGLKRIGATIEQYEALLSAQSGRCVLCPSVETPRRKLAVDHCHTTGRIRGLLCTNCNNGIGRFQDDPERLRRAAGYLER